MKKSFHAVIGNGFGAFADAAILLPLIVAMSAATGTNGVRYAVTAGLAYLFAGLVFRVPMPVQPLKSIAIASLALGASFAEIRASGFLLGSLFCLLALLPAAARAFDRVPRALIYSVQFSLGILLILQGLKAGTGLAPGLQLLAAAIVILVLAAPRLLSFPLLGLIATAGVLYGAWNPASSAAPSAAITTGVRPSILLALILPQLVLTSANSILGTRDAALRYFGNRAERVTVRNLMASIGIGNLVSALFSGLPFCHGAGGLTAHVKSGANHWSMNVVAGISLLLIAFWSSAHGGVTLSPILMASLLTVTGIYHLQLARPLLATAFGRLELLAAATAVVITHNLLYSLAFVILLELLRSARPVAVPSERRVR